MYLSLSLSLSLSLYLSLSLSFFRAPTHVAKCICLKIQNVFVSNCKIVFVYDRFSNLSVGGG